MKKNWVKIIIFCSLFILCTGWTNKYEINANFDSFSDKLTMTFNYNLNNLTGLDTDTRETVSDLINNDIVSVGRKKYYKKTIEAADGLSTITLEGKYKYKEFKYINMLSSCFDQFEVYQDKKYTDIVISGGFNCDEYKFDKLYFKTNNKVVANNDSEEDGYLVWNIDESWNDIQISMTRMTRTIYIASLIVVGSIIVLGLCFILIKYVRSNKL